MVFSLRRSRCGRWTCNSAKTQIKQTINTNFFRSWTSRGREREKIRVSIAMLVDWRKILFSCSTIDLPFLSLIVRNDAKFVQVQLEPVQAEVSQLWHVRTRHRIWSSNWIIHVEVRLCVDVPVRFHLCHERVNSIQTKRKRNDVTNEWRQFPTLNHPIRVRVTNVREFVSVHFPIRIWDYSNIRLIRCNDRARSKVRFPSRPRCGGLTQPVRRHATISLVPND